MDRTRGSKVETKARLEVATCPVFDIWSPVLRQSNAVASSKPFIGESLSWYTDTHQALFGLRTDLDLTIGNRYSMTAAIFYLGFIAGAYPAMVLAQRYPIERVASIIVVLWGVCLTLTSACHNYQSIYVQRFFLGFLEAGISPMFMLIVVGPAFAAVFTLIRC